MKIAVGMLDKLIKAIMVSRDMMLIYWSKGRRLLVEDDVYLD